MHKFILKNIFVRAFLACPSSQDFALEQKLLQPHLNRFPLEESGKLLICLW